MKTLSIILTLLCSTACTQSSHLPTAPSAVVGDTTMFARGGRADRSIRLSVQAGTTLNGQGVFLSGVDVTVQTTVGTFSAATERKGTALLDIPATVEGTTAVITLTKSGCSSLTATVQLSGRRRQTFQFAMSCQPGVTPSS